MAALTTAAPRGVSKSSTSSSAKIPVWAQPLEGEGRSTSLKAGERIKVMTQFSGDLECHEEYGVKDRKLLLRKWRQREKLGGVGRWQVEIGSEEDTAVGVAGKRSSGGGGGSGKPLMQKSRRNPEFVAQDDPAALIWRVRNIPYPEDVYSVTVDDEAQQLVLRTSNRKYFKRFRAPAVSRAGVALDAERVSFQHSNNTLVIRYEKPLLVRQQEARDGLRKMKAAASGGPGAEGCAQQ